MTLWKSPTGDDGRLVSELTRIFVKTVLGFYRERGGGPPRGQSGAVVAVQRTSSDLKLNPHEHAVFLDGTYRDNGEALDFRAVGHLSKRDVAVVLKRARDRMVKWLRRRGLLFEGDDSEHQGNGSPRAVYRSAGPEELLARTATHARVGARAPLRSPTPYADGFEARFLAGTPEGRWDSDPRTRTGSVDPSNRHPVSP